MNPGSTCTWCAISDYFLTSHSRAEIFLRVSNTVVFNLWSACLEIKNVATPMFNNWTSSCKGNGTSITNNDYPLHDAAKGINIPTWAYINLNADSSFDLGAALQSGSRFCLWRPSVVGVLIL